MLGWLSQAGLDLWGVLENRTEMHGTALTALEPLVFPRISTVIGLVLAPAVDGMLSQPAADLRAQRPLSYQVYTTLKRVERNPAWRSCATPLVLRNTLSFGTSVRIAVI